MICTPAKRWHIINLPTLDGILFVLVPVIGSWFLSAIQLQRYIPFDYDYEHRFAEHEHEGVRFYNCIRRYLSPVCGWRDFSLKKSL